MPQILMKLFAKEIESKMFIHFLNNIIPTNSKTGTKSLAHYEFRNDNFYRFSLICSSLYTLVPITLSDWPLVTQFTKFIPTQTAYHQCCLALLSRRSA